MTKRKKDSDVAEVSPAEVAADVPTPAAELAAPPEPATPASSVEALHRQLEDAERRDQELLTKLQYAQADLENVRKRAEREVVDAVRFANERLLASLLPVLDEFDAAMATAEAGAAKGLEMVRDDLFKVLREAGLDGVPTAGTFDPYLHEAVGRLNDEALPEGSIKEVVQKGYRFNFKLLRPAKVIVVRKGGET